jgi:outer membrane protein assembly factor BamB
MTRMTTSGAHQADDPQPPVGAPGDGRRASSTSRGSRPDGRPARLVDVELAEEDATAAVERTAIPHGPARPERRSVRLVRRWWRPVAIGLAVALVTASVIAARRESARLASLTNVDGVVASLKGPPHADWSTTTAVWSTPIETAGRVVYATQRGDGGMDVVALDARTGTEDWRTPLGAPASDTSASLTGTCVAVTASGEPVRHLVACLAGLFLFSGSASDTPTVTATSTDLELIDAVSGVVVKDLPTASATAIDRIGPDLVRAEVTADGHLRVERTDPLSSTSRWTFTSPSAWPTVDASNLGIGVVAGRILVQGGATAWSVLSADGAVIRSSEQAASSGRVSGFTGAQLFTESPSATAGTSRTEVLDLSTGTSFTVEGYPAGAFPDDRSLPGVILTQTGGSLLASDAATGAHRWSTPLSNGGQVMVVDGLVVIDDPNSLRAIDGRSGSVTWEQHGATRVDHSAVTDGSVVVCVVSKPDGTVDMTAYGLADGVPRWTISVPSLTRTLTTMGRRLVTVAEDRLTVWG